ncbi:FAD-dependent oxidoreductase [Desulfatirhabdium butyrativorans]|uniref:FAD-dependent oxidoreductase n=1 Tax=Desulfatirhabdium butyrativorans TaxID=340467 RepID=UPI00041E25C6|nr:FAD-dependent oxidoreductase [Desulfatirhabdium butyrativorans]
MKIVIIGADAAGMSAASRIRRNRPDFEVHVLERTTDVSFSACNMPYNIADPSRSMDDLIVRSAAAFQKQGIHLYLGHEALSIDRARRKVEGKTVDGKIVSFPYDRLLIATGASAKKPRIPGIDAPGVLVLRHLEDGRGIKSWLASRNPGHVAILGMGYIALEMAEALVSRGIRVSMIKPGPLLLPDMARQLAQVIQSELESKGVALHPGVPIEAIEHSADGIQVMGQEGFRLSADGLLCATGVIPNSALAATAGIRLGVQNAIETDALLRTSDPFIYAAGDCADALHIVSRKKVWIPLALRANRAGWAAADAMCGNPKAVDGIAGTAVFKVFDLEVAKTGLSRKEAEQAGFDPVEIVIESRSRAHAYPGGCPIWVNLLADRESAMILGGQIVGKEGAAHRINAIAVALHVGMTVFQFYQTDLAYAPPFSPVWDPMLTAANQLMKALAGGAA